MCSPVHTGQPQFTQRTDAVGRVGAVVVEAHHAVLTHRTVFDLGGAQDVADRAVAPARLGYRVGVPGLCGKEKESRCAVGVSDTKSEVNALAGYVTVLDPCTQPQ
jgi:hypothetical protein